MHDMILILNYSDEFSIEIARRLRAEQVFARIVPGDTKADEIGVIAPRGVILSGGPAEACASFDEKIASLGIPVLAMGYASHSLLSAMGGACANAAIAGKKAMIEYGESALFAGVASGERYFEEALTLMLPPNVRETAEAGGCTIAFEDEEKLRFGVQFELERNDPDGSAILMNFVRDVCGSTPWWSEERALEQACDVLDQAARNTSYALCGVSGGVDSTVAAILTHRAFGGRMKAIFIDTGLLREGEVEEACETFYALGVPFECVDRSQEILAALRGCYDRAGKREIVTGVMHDEMVSRGRAMEGIVTMVLGTNYSDFLHSGSNKRKWIDSGMHIAEPLLELFKEEVRGIALRVGLDERTAGRKPFPALGLGARILGEVTAERVEALRTAEAIFRDEIREAGLERKLYKYFPVLAGSETAGSEMMILRAVTLSGTTLMPARLPYDLVERTVQRIQEKYPAVSRVFYDQTPTQIGKESFS